MTLMLHLPPHLERRLTQEAAREGVAAEEYALNLLERQLPAENVTPLAALLQSWIDDGDPGEQAETFAALKEGLNANHTSDRRIFP